MPCSLGKGCGLVLDTGDDYQFINGPGEDFTVIEGDIGDGDEGYEIYGGTGFQGPWVMIGTGSGTQSFDLQGTGLSLTTGGLLSGTPVDTGSVSFTARVEDIAGSVDEKLLNLFVEPAYICGDIDGDGSDPNVADLTYLVDYLFRGGPPPPVMDAANVDGINGVNISDLTALVEYLFRSGELNCP